MGASEETIRLLTSMDASLKRIARLLEGGAGRSGATGQVASDADLDGQYGDPPVKFMPRDWKGPTFKGRKFSECPAELLDVLAETFDYFARKADDTDERTPSGKPKSAYSRKDAARARGWAARVRAGKAPGATASSVSQRRAAPANWNLDADDDGHDGERDDDPFAAGDPLTAGDIFGRG